MEHFLLGMDMSFTKHHPIVASPMPIIEDPGRIRIFLGYLRIQRWERLAKLQGACPASTNSQDPPGTKAERILRVMKMQRFFTNQPTSERKNKLSCWSIWATQAQVHSNSCIWFILYLTFSCFLRKYLGMVPVPLMTPTIPVPFSARHRCSNDENIPWSFYWYLKACWYSSICLCQLQHGPVSTSSTWCPNIRWN
jgi:hypothetical protein